MSGRVEVGQLMGDALEPVCVAEFETTDEARAHYERAKRCFDTGEGRDAPFWCDLHLDDDLVETFGFADLTGMTGYLPKRRMTTLDEYREMTRTGREINAARRARRVRA